MQKLSTIERKILALLQENSRQSVTEIAHKLGTSRTNIKSKIDRLYESGIIKRFTIDVGDLDIQNEVRLQGFFHVHLTEPCCPKLFEHIKNWESIKGSWSVSSQEVDMIILVEAISQDALEAVRDRISKLPFVKTMHTTFILREWLHKL
ncbi:Lrp/AsnC family transcriptional regulator [Pseudovibrio sp. Tun.PSC04-5.I4]|uniref:Lrp/AsnC family transcriptional regulator n=1 Tax=Pseudovibrio sp. Tun.PSC04-5.I4 TaxID=1798213 RepID=UPI000B87A658|nr:Lrp/AsnC family transcriptional regulator [Pseudovibrio sp. Tun.PSC04-5.I4]